MKKNIYFLGVILVVVLVFITGISFAYWSLNLKQEGENTLATSCFDVKFNETSGSNIKLENAFPMTDKDGSGLDAYQFTVTNHCETYAEYNIQLEVHDTSTLDDQYVKIKLDSHSPQLLNNYNSMEETLLHDTNKGYILETGYLDSEESKSYDLRVWLDERVTTETKNENDSDVEKSAWGGYITLSASYINKPETNLSGINVPVVEEGDGLHKIDHKEYTGTNKGFANSEFRYEGSNPNNYVKFNNEENKWRIIGLVNVQTEGGVDERIKLIGEEIEVTDEEETNWNDSSLMNNLNNGDYYTTNLTSEAKSMIDTDIIWSIYQNDSSDKTADSLYQEERENGTEWKSTNDIKASIGLMYTSDYLYACTDSLSTDSCNNWIKPKEESLLLSEGSTKKIQPVLYLSSNVKIVSGSGTTTDNYILEMNEN